jgi:pyruvate kinase
VPIYAFSPDPRTVNQLTLSWGTTPFKTEERTSADELVREALTITSEAHDLQSGDTVIVISGQSTRSRETDTLRIMRIP